MLKKGSDSLYEHYLNPSGPYIATQTDPRDAAEAFKKDFAPVRAGVVGLAQGVGDLGRWANKAIDLSSSLTSDSLKLTTRAFGALPIYGYSLWKGQPFSVTARSIDNKLYPIYSYIHTMGNAMQVPGKVAQKIDKNIRDKFSEPYDEDYWQLQAIREGARLVAPSIALGAAGKAIAATAGPAVQATKAVGSSMEAIPSTVRGIVGQLSTAHPVIADGVKTWFSSPFRELRALHYLKSYGPYAIPAGNWMYNQHQKMKQYVDQRQAPASSGGGGYSGTW